MQSLIEDLGADALALLRALIATSVDGIMVIDQQGMVLVYSQACLRLFGYAPEEVLGRNVKMLMPEPYRGEHDGYLAHYRKTGERHIIGIGRDVTGRRKDGSTFPMYLSVGEGSLNGRRIFVGIVHDISGERDRDRKIQELQAGLLHATRVTAMGQMSSAIAHELNQPLGAIAAYAGALEAMIEKNSPVDSLREPATGIARNAARAGQIIRRLRDFVEKGESHRVPEEIAALVDEAVEFAALDARARGTRVSVLLEPHLPAVTVDRVQIQQVLVNLIRNAAEAVVETPQPSIDLSVRRDGEGVLFRIADNGPGIAPDIAAHLFEPFTTSKPDGMGMGLNICRTIIEAHGGRIWMEEGGAGAVFLFRLPA
jgi:two-component system sensor kinase FixL